MAAMDRIPIGDDPATSPTTSCRCTLRESEPEPDEPEMSYEDALAADARRSTRRRGRPAGAVDARVRGRGPDRARHPRRRRPVRGRRHRLRRRAPSVDAGRRQRRADEQHDPAATLAGAGLGAAVTAAEAAASAATSAADTMAPARSHGSSIRSSRRMPPRWRPGRPGCSTGSGRPHRPRRSTAASSFLSPGARDRDGGDGSGRPDSARPRTGRRERDRRGRRHRSHPGTGRSGRDRRPARRRRGRRQGRRATGDRQVDRRTRWWTRVDIERVVERVDVTSIVDRLDLATIAQEVIDDVDLPRHHPRVFGRDGEREHPDGARARDERRRAGLPHRRQGPSARGPRSRTAVGARS